MTEPEQDATTGEENKRPSTTDESPAHRVDPSRPPSSTRPACPILNGLGFALIAALMTVQPLAAMTFLRLFYDKSPELIQPALPEGLPIPRSLVWPPRLYGFLSTLGSVTSAAVLGLYIFFSLCFLYGLFRILNPTFRMTTGVDWDRHLLWKTYMHSDPLTKAFLIVIAAVVPAFLIWHALAWALGDNAFSLWLRLTLLGAAIWFLFSREGVAGDYETGSYEPPRDASTRRSLLFRGAVAGTAAWLMIRLAPTMDVDTLFKAYRAIGFIGPGEWLRIAGLTVGFAAAFGFAAGGLFTSLGAPWWTVLQRFRASAVPAVALIVAALFGKVWVPDHFARRYDFQPRSSVPTEAQLARICKLDPKANPKTAYALEADRALPVRLTGESVTHLAATPKNAESISRYLKSRDDRTALSYPAYTTLHDAALLGWSVDDALSVHVRNLSASPEMAYVSHLLNRLQSAAFVPTPRVTEAIDLLMDERRFEYTDRRAWVMTGDICARFGQRQKAETCYRKAEMPASQVTLRAEERTQLPDGSLAGRLLFAGKPVGGARVGLMSEQGGMQLGPLTDPGTNITSPFWLSWLGASTTTDANGRFALNKLMAGRYIVVIELPQSVYNGSAVLPLKGGPGVVTVRPGSPSADLGDIALSAASARASL